MSLSLSLQCTIQFFIFPSEIFGCGENERQSSKILNDIVPIALRPKVQCLSLSVTNKLTPAMADDMSLAEKLINDLTRAMLESRSDG